MPTINDIVDMKKEFSKNNVTEPTKLFLTREDEIDLSLSVCQRCNGSTAQEVIVSGRLNGLFPKLLGMEVVYGSDRTYVT